MDTQCNNNNITGTAPDSATSRMSKEELQQKSDRELLSLVEKSKGHTGNDFGEYMNCDFSYSYLTTVLKDRGYENGWHKTSDAPTATIKPVTIQMRKSDDTVSRQSYMIDKSVAYEWKQFNKNVPYKTVTLGYALRRFMDDYNSGRIKFEFEI